MRRALDCLTVAVIGLALLVGVLGFRVLELGGQVDELAGRPAYSATLHAPVSTAAATCAAAACVTVPYASSAYGPGTAGVGLLVTGSHGFGGTSLRLDDYEHAPEGWFRLGSWYVLAKPGWAGGSYCIVDVPARPKHPPLPTWRTLCLTPRLLGRLIARFGS